MKVYPSTDSRSIKVVRHPNGHGIECCIDEKHGLIEIIHGACKTILKVKPGPVGIEFMKKQMESRE